MNCTISDRDSGAMLYSVASYKPMTRLISAIHVPVNYRNRGIGTKLMREAMLAADLEGITLELVPAGRRDAMSTEALIVWYRKLGFEFRDPEFLENWVMFRNPQAIQNPSFIHQEGQHGTR